MAWTISVRVHVFWYGLNDWQQEIPGMLSLWVKAFQSCGLITDQVIEFITKSKADLWLFCWLVVTSAPSPEISKPPYAWQGIYRSVIMAKTITARYDVAEHLRTPEEMAAYLEACLDEAHGDAAFIAKALGDIARAKGMSQVARDAGLSRESLYKALSGERSPAFETILKVMGALGLKLHAEAVHVNSSMAQQKL